MTTVVQQCRSRDIKHLLGEEQVLPFFESLSIVLLELQLEALETDPWPLTSVLGCHVTYHLGESNGLLPLLAA